MIFFDKEGFIRQHITRRTTSMFQSDILTNDDKLRQEIMGSKVLVIGGAGTIGSSYIKAILPYEPESLVVVDYSENGLTELTRDLRSQQLYIPNDYITYPFDFGGKVFEKLMQSRSFDIIACFAAHKHVRSEKDHLAIEAMMRNNVFNTHQLLEQAISHRPKHFFSVSTDKAANPVNVMGASKKLMENVLLAYADTLKICTARFANVAFSNGSLLAGFIERMMKKQPLSAPSDVKRYFVSPEESGQLCMLASILGKSGDIFFPKLYSDQMMTFSRIAELFLEELGLSPDYCSTEEEAKEKARIWQNGQKKYPVLFFNTDTAGEKPYEEFYTDQDSVNLGLFKALGVISNNDLPGHKEVVVTINTFKDLFNKEALDKRQVIETISGFLSDFDHIETGKSLDQKM